MYGLAPTTISCAQFLIDTHARFRYIFPSKKRALINYQLNNYDCHHDRFIGHHLLRSRRSTVSSDGGETATARGVCWSTATDPTISDAKTSDGPGLGTFTSSITGLNPCTTYHVRAYAANRAGTGYGSDVTFTTTDELHVCSDEKCGGKPNCNKTLAAAVAAAGNGSLIKAANHSEYIGNVTVLDKSLAIQAGWDTSFSSQSETSTLQGAPVVSNGSVILQQVKIEP